MSTRFSPVINEWRESGNRHAALSLFCLFEAYTFSLRLLKHRLFPGLLDSDAKRFNHAFMKTAGYQAAPFQITRWAAVIAVLAALTYLVYLLVDPLGQHIIKPDQSAMGLIDWIIFGSPIVLLIAMTISAFAPRVVALLHITAIAAACSIPVVLLNSRNQVLAFLVAPICFWVLMYFHALALRKEKQRLANLPDDPSDAPHRIESELDCIYCDYNLNRLMTDGVCPECGMPVSPSLMRERLSFTQPRWAYIFRQGLRFFTIGTLTQAVVELMVQYTRAFQWNPVYAMYLLFAATTFQLAGVWLLTVKSRNRGDNRGRVARIMIRVLAGLYAAIYWLFLLSDVLWRLADARKISPSWVFSFPNLTSQFDTIETIIYAFLLWHIALYVYILSTRMPSRRAGRFALLGGMIVLVSAGFNTLLPILYQCLIQFLPSIGDDLNDIVRTTLEQAPGVYLSIFLLAFSFFFWRYYSRAHTRPPQIN